MFACADRGLSKGEFVTEITRLLGESAQCDRVDVWLRDHGKYLHCTGGRSGQLALRSSSRCGRDNGRDLRSGPILVPETRFPSVLLVPVLSDSRVVGQFRLKSGRKGYFPPAAVDMYEQVSWGLGLSVAHLEARASLQERIKEQSCLYAIARILAQPDTWLEDVLRSVVNSLPAAWLHPEIAGARVVLDGKSFSTPDYRNPHSRQQADIVVGKRRVGSVEVGYFAEKPALDEGPFLKEERRLLEAVAGEIAVSVGRREAEREKLRLEDQLRHADRLTTLGQLAAGVAHELNEPLVSVVGFAQLAKKCPGLPEPADRDLDKVLTASLRAREIVRSLLTFSRKTPPGKAEADLNGLVSESLKFFESRCAKEGIKIICSLSPSRPVIEVDPSLMNQVLVNLMVNAVQAMPTGGVLRIRTRLSDGHASLIVADTGVGMEKDVLKNVLIPFFTTKNPDEGTGLGLPIAQGITESYGGTLRIASRPGAGTTCTVKLPARSKKGRRLPIARNR
jgi:signal transduction histidine kinase